MADDPSRTDAPVRARPSRRALTLVGLPLAAMVIAGYVGDAFAPTLVDTHPAWLIALNARNRNLVLVTNYVDVWTFYGIGIVRLMLSDPLFFLLGYWFGEAFEGPLDDVVGWIGDNRLILLPISIALVILSIALEAKRGETEVAALTRLDEEIADTTTEAGD